MIDGSSQWQIRQDNKGRLHVVPVADLKEHEPHGECWCMPEITEHGAICHQAVDEREKFESGERKPS